MNSMTDVIEPKSDQINADDLIGGDMVITITGVKIQAGQEQPVAISFDGSPKVFRPCKSMSRVLVAIWGPDANKYVGRSLKLYRDPDVTWGGLKVGGIRIREMSDMDGGNPVTLALTEKRGSRRPAVIKPLTVQPAPKGDGPDHKESARAAARRGTEAFRAWWNSEAGKTARASGVTADAELRKLCADADAAMDADPFGLPPLDHPTPEELARAKEEALAAARADEDAARQEEEA